MRRDWEGVRRCGRRAGGPRRASRVNCCSEGVAGVAIGVEDDDARTDVAPPSFPRAASSLRDEEPDLEVEKGGGSVVNSSLRPSGMSTSSAAQASSVAGGLVGPGWDELLSPGSAMRCVRRAGRSSCAGADMGCGEKGGCCCDESSEVARVVTMSLMSLLLEEITLSGECAPRWRKVDECGMVIGGEGWTEGCRVCRHAGGSEYVSE